MINLLEQVRIGDERGEKLSRMEKRKTLLTSERQKKENEIKIVIFPKVNTARDSALSFLFCNFQSSASQWVHQHTEKKGSSHHTREWCQVELVSDGIQFKAFPFHVNSNWRNWQKDPHHSRVRAAKTSHRRLLYREGFNVAREADSVEREGKYRRVEVSGNAIMRYVCHILFGFPPRSVRTHCWLLFTHTRQLW